MLDRERMGRASVCLLAMLVGVALVLGMVTGISAGDGTVLPTAAFYIVETQPVANALDVSPSSAITVTFNAAVDAGAISSSTLVVMGASSGAYPGLYTVIGDSQVRFEAAQAFQPGEIVQVMATAAIMSAVGDSLQPHAWRFNTATAGGLGHYTTTHRHFGYYGFRTALGDLDGDGDLDAVTSDREGQVWLNDGQGVFVDSHGQLGAKYDVALGDLDGDGDLDAVVTGDENGAWLNDGRANFTSGPGTLGSAGYDVTLGDADGDADLDLMMTGRLGEENALWINDGHGAFEQSPQQIGSRTASDIALGDLDGDGDLDAFLSIFERTPEVWINDNGIFTSTAQSLTAVLANSVALGDIDGDHDLDAFLAVNGQDQVLLNDGQASFSDSGQVLPDHNSDIVTLGDVDSDGDLDAMIAGPDGYDAYVELLINDGAGIFSESQRLPGWALHNCLGDVDGDGDLDAILTKSGEDSSTVWINLSPQEKASFVISSTWPASNTVDVQASTAVTVTFNRPLTSSAPALASFRLQGDLHGPYPFQLQAGADRITLSTDQVFRPGETIMATALGDVRSLGGDYLAPSSWQFSVAASGQGLFVARGLGMGDRETLSAVAEVGDLDGDGDLDAITVELGAQEPVVIWFNNGSGRFTESNQRYGNYNFTRNLDLGDLDGDGDLDLFIAERDNRPNTVWLNDGSGRFSNSGQALGDQNTVDAALGDLDHDGDLDAFVVNGAYSRNARIWLNDGHGSFISNGQKLPTGDSYSVEIGDLDGDGDLDAFVASGHQDTVWLNDGAGVFFGNGQTLTGSHSKDVALGDLDGDHDLDAYVVQDENMVWLNNGHGTFVDSGQRLPSDGGQGVALGDVDGDGDLDALVVEVGDYWNGAPNTLWLNDGQGLFVQDQLLGAPWDARASAQVSALADLNGDRALDAFVVNAYDWNRVWFNTADHLHFVPLMTRQ